MIRRLLFWLSGFLRVRLITRRPGEPYLERYFLGQLFGRTFYLHRFVAPDLDEGTHDHPWRVAWSLVLVGWYQELVAIIDPRSILGLRERSVRRGALSLFRIDRQHWHRIVDVAPDTWTLFWHTDWLANGWGFLDVDPDVICEGGEEHFTAMATFRPYRIGRPAEDWWTTAPRGRDSDRAPLQTGRA